MEELLSRASAELAIRSEVESTLSSLLLDVETAHSLQISLDARYELRRCEERLEALKARYDAREAEWEVDRRERETLGNALLGEIVRLSAREVEGDGRREEVERRLRKLEDEKRNAAGEFGAERKQPAAAGERSNEEREINEIEADESKVSEADDGNDDSGEGPIISDATNEAADERPVDGDGERAADVPAPIQQQVVQSFLPHDLDETTLMNIFAHLDPLDVMNFAQTNKALLAKVNIMFGMGSESREESDVEQQQQQTSGGSGEKSAVSAAATTTIATASATASVEKNLESPPPASQTVAASASIASTTSAHAGSSSMGAEAATSSTAPPKSPSKASPKLYGTPGPSHRRQGSGTSVATAGSTGAANPFSQVSSWFGGGGGGGGDSSSTAAAAPSAPANAAAASAAPPPAADSSNGSEIKLNAAMATSMASKLTPAELSVILRMRERLQRCESDAARWRLEKEEALANLASVEAVKEFLVSRVRDTERAAQGQREEMAGVRKKGLEDREVIVFLDRKVKELEKVVEDMKARDASTRQEALDSASKNEKKARVLSDMLRFEREQAAANEREWKAARKVLVKEVKSCRARIVALEAEADGCRQQNLQLKQGLMSLSHSSGPMSPGGRRNMKR